MTLQFERLISVIDTHTEGEPTRIITGGVHPLPGKTMADKRNYFKLHYDGLRKLLMLEPRGHDNMFGALLVEPTHPQADLGVIFMDTFGYLNMCGHGSIGVATVAIESGLIPPKARKNQIVLDTPAGLVYTNAHITRGKVQSVTLQNVPSFLYQKDLQICTPSLDQINLDIAFGGNFFGILSSSCLEGSCPDRFENAITAGMEILTILKDIPINHPTEAHINSIDLVEFSMPPSSSSAQSRNLVIFGNRQVDRCPCGTGTSAKMAALYARGKLKLHERYCAESILGTFFVGELVKEVMVGSYPAVIPLITGSAHVTALSEVVLDPSDPLKMGFSIRNELMS